MCHFTFSDKYSVHLMSLVRSASGANNNACSLLIPTNALTRRDVTMGTKYNGSPSRFIKERVENATLGSKVLPVM